MTHPSMPSMVYGATQAAVVVKKMGATDGNVVIPVDVLALLLQAAHSAGRVDGMTELSACRARFNEESA